MEKKLRTVLMINFADQRGQLFILALITLAVITIGTLAIISGSFTYKQNSRYSLEAIEAINLAEAGADKAVASLNKLGSSYNGESETQLSPGTYEVTVSLVDTQNKIIRSTGYVPNKANPKTKRTVTIKASTGVGVSFNYGIQVGEGGLELGNGNIINGSIYSNGNIKATSNNNTITGDTWVAEGLQPLPDQETDCTDPNCQEYIFGKNESGQDRIDVAQSFKPAASNVLNKVSFKIKKVGDPGPGDVLVRLTKDKNGEPDKNNVLASGVLNSSLVTGSFGWIDVTFSTAPQLTGGNTYWLMINTNSSPSKYWVWQKDSLPSYPAGEPKWSPNWQTGNPSWNPVGGDLSFKTQMGGVITSIKSEANNFTVNGDVHANTIENMNILKNAYYQTIINTSVSGTSYPRSTVPAPKVFPISDANIIDWKDQADGPGGTNVTGTINDCVSTLGPIKVEGDVTFNSHCIVIINSPVWITGNLTINSNNRLSLNPSYDSTSGVIVVDGRVELGSNNKMEGTGIGNSILMVLSNYDSKTNLIPAIVVTNEGNNGVYYAKDGIIEPGNKNEYTELTAWGIKLINNSTLNYLTGLSSSLFSSGPSGSFSLVKGTYQLE